MKITIISAIVLLLTACTWAWEPSEYSEEDGQVYLMDPDELERSIPNGSNGRLGGNTGMQNGRFGGNTGMQNGRLGGNTGMQNGRLGGNTGMQNGRLGGNTGMQNGRLVGNTGMQNGRLVGNTGMQNGRLVGNMGMQNGGPGGNVGMQNGKPMKYTGLPNCGSGFTNPQTVKPTRPPPPPSHTGKHNTKIVIIVNRENGEEEEHMVRSENSDEDVDYEGNNMGDGFREMDVENVDQNLIGYGDEINGYLGENDGYDRSYNGEDQDVAVHSDGYDNQQYQSEDSWYGHQYPQGGNGWNVHSRSNYDDFGASSNYYNSHTQDGDLDEY